VAKDWCNVGWFDEGASGSPVDVSKVFTDEAIVHLLAMVQAGALISIGVTSDGGALGITVTVDGNWRREYFRDWEQLELWTSAAVAPVTAAADLARASAVQGSRRRGRKGA
jgi:hypothetical protein